MIATQITTYVINTPNRGVYLGLNEKGSAHFSKFKPLHEGLIFTNTNFMLERIKWIRNFICGTADYVVLNDQDKSAAEAVIGISASGALA